MSAIGFILSQVFLQSAFAASMDVPVVAGDRLILKGLVAQVHFVAQPGNSLRINGLDEGSAEGAYTLTKKDNVIEIKMNEFIGKRSWLSALSRPASLKKLEIFGSAVPVDVQLREGSVVVQKWSKDTKVSLSQGRVSVSNGTGDTQIYLQKGDVLVQDHSGKVKVDAYNGTVAIRNVTGDVDASLFAGQLQVEKVNGFLNLTTQQSNSKVNTSTGTLQFENGKGSLSVQSYQGRIEGVSQDGSVSITTAIDSEVDVKTKMAKVTVQTPPGSGASLNLVTEEGDLFVPSELKVVKNKMQKSVRGRLRGDAQRGSVFVRSQEGTISVK